MKNKVLILLLLTLTACSIPVDQPPPPAALSTDTPQPAVTSTQTYQPVATSAQTPMPLTTPTFCNDPRGRDLVTAMLRAVQTKDGALLASLISPVRGMDVMYYRDGKIVNYDVEHARFIFETTFQADWGLSYGSGEPTIGSFQEIVLPSLQIVFTPTAELTCNQLKVGGTTYEAIWPYPYMDFFSVYYVGTDPNGGLDWQTWAVGIEKAEDNLYIAALVHYVWEP